MLKIGIFSLSGCEGCQLRFLSLNTVLKKIEAEIIYWPLIGKESLEKPLNIAFVEGSPLQSSDQELARKIRKISMTVVSLGACGAFGRLGSLDRIPLSEIIYPDYEIPGCPVEAKQIEKLIFDILLNKKENRPVCSVCRDCKERENPCLHLKEKPCLGPITKNGCGALCPSLGYPCWGCLGSTGNRNLKKDYALVPFELEKVNKQARTD